ncbi:hypothetical protein ACEPPN_006954 [Leptodophora sp. 'Broadleaf-Isolate-01']
MSSVQSSGRAFKQAKVSNLSIVLEFDHGLDRLLNWSIGINPLLEIQIDVVYVQAVEASCTSFLDIVWLTANKHSGFSILDLGSEFCSQKDLVPSPSLSEPPFNESLIDKGPETPDPVSFTIDTHISGCCEDFNTFNLIE